MPDFFIVGHAKSGTTALHRMLSSHPRIHMPAKEPRFFAIREIDIDGGPASGSLADQPGRRPRTLDGYLALFAGARADQLIGEATPVYLRSARAASRIASVCPDARIIVILREPASFLRSFHLQSVRGYNETQKDFRKAIALVEQRREGRSIPRLSRTPADLLYVDHVRYVEQLRRYHAVFPPERVLVLIYEDFRRDNEASVRTVLRFLELEDTVAIRPVKTLASRDLRFRPLHRLVKLRRVALRNLAVADALSRATSTLTPARWRGSVKSNWRSVAYGKPPPVDEEYMRELRRRFKPEVEALRDYLGRDDLLSLWGYDDAG